MMDAPNKIWLQRPNRDPENEWCGEVTWCEDKQNDDDTCYIKASAKTQRVIEALRAELMEEARLNGMGSEREAKLMAERDAAISEIGKTARSFAGEIVTLKAALRDAKEALIELNYSNSTKCGSDAYHKAIATINEVLN